MPDIDNYLTYVQHRGKHARQGLDSSRPEGVRELAAAGPGARYLAPGGGIPS